MERTLLTVARSEAEARRPEGETRTLAEAEDGATDADRATEAGIDAAVLDRLLGAMDPGDRDAIRELCARDLEMTRRNAWLALRRWDRKALGRHLHVLSSLAQTVGADALADEAGRMQARLRSGTAAGHDANARRMDALARRAARFLADG